MKIDLQTVREQYSDGTSSDAENRELMEQDLEFGIGEQWSEAEENARAKDGRPALTVNLLPQFWRRVTDDIRQKNPAIRVIPGDEEASEDGAELFAGIIRNIEYNSDASDVYEQAAENAAKCSIGHWRILNITDDKGQPDALIEPIENPFAVVWDPLARHPTRRDANYCFVTSQMSLKQFKREYPDKSPDNWDTDNWDGDTTALWLTNDEVTVAEYFWKEDGKVYWVKVSGGDVLEEPREFPSKHIPVVAVVGEETHLGQRVVRSSVIRYALSSQQLYNYHASTEAEVAALQPKAPYKATPEQIEGYEDDWENANSENRAVMLYNHHDGVPMPQREAPPMASSAILAQKEAAKADLKSTTGIHEAALGERGNEQSGRAIKARQLGSDMSTSIYVDNLNKSVAQCGRILIDMIPRLFDTTRAIRTISEDGKTAIEQVNEPVRLAWLTGQTPYRNTLDGVYDVRIRTGPSYASRREEMQDNLTGLYPNLPPEQAAAITDILIDNMDWPGADQIVKRLRKMLPPGLVEEDEQEVTPEQAQQQVMQQQMQQMQAQMQQVMQQLSMREQQAKTVTAEANAAKAQAGVQKEQLSVQEAEIDNATARLELAAQSGELDAAALQRVMRALTGANPGPMGPLT